MVQGLFRNKEELVVGPAEVSFCLGDGFVTRRVRVCLGRSLFWHTKPDDRLDTDQFGLVLDPLSVLDRILDRLEIVAVLDHQNVPSHRLEPLGPVLGKREVCRTVDRDLVVVVEIDQVGKLEMAGDATPPHS